MPYFRAEADGGPVVIATLPVDCQADPETEAAFLCAAFDFESLAGRGLPEIVDHGVADGMPYLAYRFPPGRLLSERLAEGPLRSRTLLRVGESVLEALSISHRHGMVHGELCPENILVDEADEHPTVTLLGVGLIPLVLEARARATDRSSGPAPASSAYKAPELFAGAAPSPSADLYALGALLHHMVSGRPPEAFETADSYGDVPMLVDIVRRAMARDPSRRYESAASMRAALDWVEVESEKMSAHTQDIPLWMEHSVVGNIPVPELLRAKSTPPPARADLPHLPGYGPLAGPSSEIRIRLDGTSPRIRLDPTPTFREPSEPSIRIEVEEDRGAPAARAGLPTWAQAALATAAVLGAGVLTWVLTG